MSVDVSAILNFAQEGPAVLPALDSVRASVELARRRGIRVEAIAVLDNADPQTAGLVGRRGDWLGAIVEVGFGDVGLSRDSAVASAGGTYVAFLSGDRLWGESWIAEAWAIAVRGKDAIWHPEFVYQFEEDGFNRHSLTEAPHPSTAAAFRTNRSSNSGDFDARSLIFADQWSGDAFARREVCTRFPFGPADSGKGIGCSDWGWNYRTVSHGVPHLVVPATVHAVRLPALDQSSSPGLLPRYGD